MRENLMRRLPLFLFCVLSLLPAQAQDGSSTATSPAQMTVTVRALGKNKRMPVVNREDIIVRQGKDRLQVTGWTPLGGDRSPLDLFILIDDAARTSVSSQFGDLREFMYSLPRTTSVGVGYMRNSTVRVAQDLTTDHRQAANALRIPLGSPGVYGSDRSDEAVARKLESARDCHDHRWHRSASWLAAPSGTRSHQP